MEKCPFLKESMWDGNRCQASGDKEGAYVQGRYADYCGFRVLSSDYHKCPLYKDATGKRGNDGCYLTSACMCVQGKGFSDDCMELTVLRDFRDSYVKKNYPEDIAEYYVIAPRIVEEIQKMYNRNEIYNQIYEELIVPCCELIKVSKLYEAYDKYKKYALNLYQKYLG